MDSLQIYFEKEIDFLLFCFFSVIFVPKTSILRCMDFSQVPIRTSPSFWTTHPPEFERCSNLEIHMENWTLPCRYRVLGVPATFFQIRKSWIRRIETKERVHLYQLYPLAAEKQLNPCVCGAGKHWAKPDHINQWDTSTWGDAAFSRAGRSPTFQDPGTP